MSGSLRGKSCGRKRRHLIAEDIKICSNSRFLKIEAAIIPFKNNYISIWESTIKWCGESLWKYNVELNCL